MGARGKSKGGHTIEDEGVALPDKDSLNFVGTGVTVTDDVGKTKVDILSGADTKVNVFEAGVQIGTVPRLLDFTDVNDFIIAEDAVGDQTDIAINRNIANAIAGLDATGRLAKAQQHLATLYNDAAMIFTAAFTHNFLGGTLILDAAGNISIDNSVVNVTKLKHSTNFPNFALLRDQLVPDGSTAGKVSFRSKDSSGAERIFGEISTIIEDTTAAGNLVHGSLHISVMDGNVEAPYMNFNDAKSGQIDILKKALFSQDIERDGGLKMATLGKIFEHDFSGNALEDPPWTFTQVAGLPTQAMLDGIGEGLRISTNAAANSRGSINFNNIRHFDPALCTIWGICKFDNVDNITDMGLSRGTDTDVNANHSVELFLQATATNTQLRSGDGTNTTNTASSIALGTSAVPFKIICTATDLRLYHLVSGVWQLEVTKTSNRP